MKRHYVVAKTNKHSELVVINYDKITGFTVTPKNEIQYPGIEISSLVIVKPSFIEKVLKKKIKRKLNYYLEYMMSVAEDDDSSNFREALDSIERYKGIIEYKYRKYLDDKYINVLLKKIALLEREIKQKVIYTRIQEPQEMVVGRSR